MSEKAASKDIVEHEVIAMVFGQQMFSSVRMPQDAALKRYYEILLSNKIQPVLLDAGANIGAASLYCNRLLKKSAHEAQYG